MLVRYNIFLFFLKTADRVSFFKDILNFLRKLIMIFKPIYYLNPNGKYQRIYHYHIQKTAGTSINASFYEVEDADYKVYLKKQFSNIFTRSIEINNKIFSDHNLALINKSAFYYSWSHYPFKDIKMRDDTFSFTSLREPGERFLSFYNFLHDIKKNNRKQDFKHMSHLTKYLKKDFNEFLTNLPDQYKFSQLYMFSTNLDIEEAVNNISKINYIIIDNQFNNFFKEIENIFGIKLKEYDINKSKTKSNINFDKGFLKKEYDFYYMVKNHLNIKTGKLEF